MFKVSSRIAGHTEAMARPCANTILATSVAVSAVARFDVGL